MAPLPELRWLVAVAERYVAGQCHFSEFFRPAHECELWGKVHGVHPAIIHLARDWSMWADQVWNEFGQHPQSLPEAEFRRRVAADLGRLDPDNETGRGH
jgi:hypothetical protein